MHTGHKRFIDINVALLESIDRIFITFSLHTLFVLFELEARSEDGHKDDTSEPCVEPLVDVFILTILNLLEN